MVDPAVAGEEGRIVCPKQHQSETKKRGIQTCSTRKTKKGALFQAGQTLLLLCCSSSLSFSWDVCGKEEILWHFQRHGA